MGLSRRVAASSTASRRGTPAASFSPAKSMISSEERTTTPANAMMPMIEAPENGTPIIQCPGKTPMTPSGIAAMAINGMVNDW